jgi:hypothetical protein
MHRLERERLQDEHVQGALHEIALFSSSQSRGSIRLLSRLSRGEDTANSALRRLDTDADVRS